MCRKCFTPRGAAPFVKGRNLCRKCFNAYHRAYQQGRPRKRTPAAQQWRRTKARRFARVLAGVQVVRP